jgi:ankyrin repeat protein
MRLLLDRGADPNALDRGRKRVLTWALLQEQREAVELLLARGADTTLLGTPLCAWVFTPKLSRCS